MRSIRALLAAACRRRSSPFVRRHSTAVDPSPLVGLFYACSDIFTLHKIHAVVQTGGLRCDLYSQTKLLSSYAELGDIASARKLFDEMPVSDLYCCRVMIRAYAINQRYLDVIELYDDLNWFLGSERNDDVVFSNVLKACTKLCQFDKGKQVHCCVIKSGSSPCFVLNSLIDMYAKSEDLEMAETVFECILEPNVVSWTSLMSGYVQNSCSENGLALYAEMRRSGVKPTAHTVVTLLQACAALEALCDGRRVHGSVVKSGVDSASFVGTALLDMYVKCGKVDDALRVFEGLGSIDTVSWTAMIVGFLRHDDPLAALRLFNDEKWTFLIPSSVTIANALSAAAQLEDCNLGKGIHLMGIKLGVEESHIVTNALVDMYSKCHELVDAYDVFERAEEKDVVVWSSMIGGCVRNNSGDAALRLFHEMRASGCSADPVSVVHALSACACSPNINKCRSMHAFASKCGMLSNVCVHGALVNLYQQCADPETSRQISAEMHCGNGVPPGATACSSDSGEIAERKCASL